MSERFTSVAQALQVQGLVGSSAVRFGAPDRVCLVSGGPSSHLARWSLVAAPPTLRTTVRQPDRSTLPAAQPHSPSQGDIRLHERNPPLRAEVEEWKHGSWYHRDTIMANNPGDLFRKLADMTPVTGFDEHEHGTAPQRPFWCGALAYDLLPWTQPLRLQHPPEPGRVLTVLWRVDNGLLIDAATGDVSSLVNNAWGRAALEAVETHNKAESTTEVAPQHGDEVTVSMSEERHRALIDNVREGIKDGRFYQANIGKHWSGPIDHPWSVFQRLHATNPAPYAAYLEADDLGLALASSSPECLIETTNTSVRTAPIKGTAPQGATEDESMSLRRTMLTDDKERAEHRMLVDLMRHDLATVCKVGSVHVARFDVEAYANVQHLVSHVEGEFESGYDGIDALQAVFPGGSITGCPRTVVCATIDELEQRPRSFWTGSVGWVDVHTGQSTWNILIRTLEAHRSGKRWTGYVGAGGGITIGSASEAEVVESEWKAEALLGAAGWIAKDVKRLPRQPLTVHPVEQAPKPNASDGSTGRVVTFAEALLDRITNAVMFVDNLDSFSHNIVHAIAAEGHDVVVVHGRSSSMDDLHEPAVLFDVLDRLEPSHIVLGPGPGHPSEADLTMAIAHHAVAAQLTCPVLGICLGHQALGLASGMRVERSPSGPVHGIPVTIDHDGTGIFTRSEAIMVQTRYNSLTVMPQHDEHPLRVNAVQDSTTLVMGLAHRNGLVHGVQFHPESIGSPEGVQLLKQFLSDSSDG